MSDLALATHAESSFDPDLYVSLFYSGKYHNEKDVNISAWLQDRCHDTFKDGLLKGQKLLDIGTGPVVYPIITASKWFEEIYLSDLSKANVEFLQRWRRGNAEPMKFIMEWAAQKEKETWEETHSRVLERIKDVIECDISKQDPFSGTPLERVTFDAITSWLCLSTVTPFGIENYKRVLQNIRELLNPGGHLLVGDMLDQSFYTVGDMKFKTFSSTQEELQQTYKDAGFVIEKWDTVSIRLNKDMSDSNTAFCLLAKKI